jgi:nucleoside-diphosphate-sugar epimerase
MEDCINATISLMEEDVENLKTHADYNVAGVSFSPAELANEIKKHIPEFEIEYKPDFRQKIAESWPRSIDDSMARSDWNWSHKFGLKEITETMINNLKAKREQN